MSLYKDTMQESFTPDISESDMNELVEAYFIDDLSRMGSEQLHEWLEGEQAKALLERSVLKKPTLIRLSKADDEKRRIKLTCYYLAKNAKDPNWDKFVKYSQLRKKYRSLIFKKYANKATRIARIAQKNFIKSAQKQQPTASDRMH